MTKELKHGMLRAIKTVDLGTAQSDLELAAKNMKKAQADLNKAQQTHTEAELAYDQANKSLLNAVATLRETTKIKV